VLATIFEGVDAYATARGYQAVVANTQDDLEERRHRLDLLVSRRIDGLILADAHLDDDFEEIRSANLPFVLVNRRAPGLVSVTCADNDGGRMVGEHLAELGHRRVAIVGGHPWASTAVDRAEGCRQALADHGVVVEEDQVVFSGFGIEGGTAATHRLLDGASPPTAVFAVNDYAAIGVMGALRDRGLVPGRDVAVVGFNDIDVAAQLPIPLTSVATTPENMGAGAAESLLTLLEGRRVRSRRIKPNLVIRASTQPRTTTSRS
jgi:LacI family transcriptional regulator